MQFPEQLADRFRQLESLKDIDDGGVWLVSDHSGRRFVLKAMPEYRSPDLEVFSLLRQIANGIGGILQPVEWGPLDGGLYQISPYFWEGTLADRLRDGPLSGEECLALVSQLNEALRILHGPHDGKSIVHGDVKPSNILLGQDRGERRLYILADFDAASVSEYPLHADGARQGRRYTLRYAAPEVVGGGTVSPAADYWSMGMLLLECLAGRHPLVDETGRFPDDGEVKSLLSSDWRPRPRTVAHYWRALFGGLLERNPTIRWRHQEVGRWLDRDPATISDGLSMAGEPATSTPFIVGGAPAYSSQGLAEALLTQWEVIR